MTKGKQGLYVHLVEKAVSIEEAFGIVGLDKATSTVSALGSEVESHKSTLLLSFFSNLRIINTCLSIYKNGMYMFCWTRCSHYPLSAFINVLCLSNYKPGTARGLRALLDRHLATYRSWSLGRTV